MKLRRIELALATAALALGLASGCAPRSAIEARGVVLMVGDGMGVASVTAARAHKGSRDGVSPPPDARLFMDAAPAGALVRTWSTDHLVTDSAAGITAMVTGVKVASGVVSARASAQGAVEALVTLLEIAEQRGLSTGIVTTTRLTHATPAGAYAHVLDRNQETQIAAALVDNPQLGDGVEVLLGGGREVLTGEAGDGGGRDVVAELAERGYAVVYTGAELAAAVDRGAERILGLFAADHLAFEADRAARFPEEPSLEAMTEAALRVLRRNPKGYFLLVEGGRIDHAHHVNSAYRAVLDTLAFDDALGVVVGEAGGEAVVYVTADHDHTMVIAGYPPIASGAFGQAGVGADEQPYTTLLYANGPSALEGVTAGAGPGTATTAEHLNRAAVPLEYETHGGMDVPLYAFGPEALRPKLAGSIDNTEIFDQLKAALDAIAR